MIPVSYSQLDPRWRYNDYSAGGEKTNIGESGCGPSCMAMVIASLADSSVTPATTSAWAKANGYKAPYQGTYYSYFTPQGKVYDIKVNQMNYSNNYYANNQYNLRTQVLTELADGNWVIACMGKGRWTSSGHFVLAYAVENNQTVYIRDPYNTKPNCLVSDKQSFLEQAKYFFKIDVQDYLARHAAPQEDDEVIESRPIKIFDTETKVDTIFKEDRNFMSPRIFEQAGFTVGNEGSKPIVSMPGVKVNGKDYPGFYYNGQAFIALETYEKSLGSNVGWDGTSVLIKR